MTPSSVIVRAIQQVLARRDVPYRSPSGRFAYSVYSIEMAGQVARAVLIDAETGAVSTHDLDRPELISIWWNACPEARP